MRRLIALGGIAFIAVGVLGLGPDACAEPVSETAGAFGARPTVAHLRLSPDGRQVAYIAPLDDRGSSLVIFRLEDGQTQGALSASGDPEQIDWCSWVANDRLICHLSKNFERGGEILPITRLVAVDTDGGNVKVLSNQQSADTHGLLLHAGSVVDWLPGNPGSVLMARHYLPDDKLGTRLGSKQSGLGVDLMDTRKGIGKTVERPVRNATDFISDGNGQVRIMAMQEVSGDRTTGVTHYVYRAPDAKDWAPLSDFDSSDYSGYLPLAIEAEKNRVLGMEKRDGRLAIVAMSLDESREKTLVYAHPEVDVSALIRTGNSETPIGVSYVTDSRHAAYFDPSLEQLVQALHKALPDQAQLAVIDATDDGRQLLVLAADDDDPGVYYLFDREQKSLQTFLVVRDGLEGRSLAQQKSIRYTAKDGVEIPGYLTLPPGVESAQGLPAIVMPHGGPSSRDEWGFDWLAQYYAALGYAVLQPNFRGSAGYGDDWFRDKGFSQWQVAIGDVVSAGQWLVSEGMADPNRLAIVGWSYGGYAALQSAVVEPGLFKAIVAIAPVTDLALLKEQHRDWSDSREVNRFVGSGPHIEAGSPLRHVNDIKVPVLLVHGTMDANVEVRQSREMAAALKSSGSPVTYLEFEGLDHYLEDSSVRTTMLQRSAEILTAAFASSPE